MQKLCLINVEDNQPEQDVVPDVMTFQKCANLKLPFSTFRLLLPLAVQRL